MDEATVYRFKGRATGSDSTGYYYPRWDLAQRFSVIAETKADAEAKALQMLGSHPQFGRWAIHWDAIKEVKQDDEQEG